MQRSFVGPFTHRFLAHLSQHEIHADMEAVSIRGMGQAKVFWKQQKFPIKNKFLKVPKIKIKQLPQHMLQRAGRKGRGTMPGLTTA